MVIQIDWITFSIENFREIVKEDVEKYRTEDTARLTPTDVSKESVNLSLHLIAKETDEYIL